ncbi:MAG: response regulator transcription factor, partial [Planctomycetes bacterium]|nr:response regulator transcription factor [Planctomycetota bacterium]
VRNICIPIIMLTGCGDVPTAVRAMKQGAIDFIEKPFSSVALLEVVRYAIQKDMDNHSRRLRKTEMRKRVACLTPREREVMKLVVSGLPNKQIAGELGVAIKTVEAHRAHVMRKTQAVSLPELVRLAHGGGL